MMLNIIRSLLQKFIDDIDTGNSNIDYEDESKILSLLCNIANKDQRMSKIQASDYLGVSRATFDNLVKDGFIPKVENKMVLKNFLGLKQTQIYIYIT